MKKELRGDLDINGSKKNELTRQDSSKSLDMFSMNKELSIAKEIIRQAGEIVLQYCGGNDLDTTFKIDAFDPVTKADLESEKIITKAIQEYFPNDKILSEETQAELKDFSGRVRMIDPLDGTKDFIGKGENYSIMIGLCNNGEPQMGVVFAPAKGELYYAVQGQGAYMETYQDTHKTVKLQVTAINTIEEARYLSKSKFSEKRSSNETLDTLLPFKEIKDGGSVGVVLGEIAKGNAECYILTNRRACKRDACAGEIIVKEAGGMVTDISGEKINYLTPDKSIPNLLVATNGKIHKEIIKVTDLVLKNQ